MNDLLQAGLEHLDAGRSVIPVNAKKAPHAPALRATGHVQGDTASWKLLQTERPTAQHLRTWLSHPHCGLALVTGEISRIVVIDVDFGEGTAHFNQWGLTERAHVRTRSGGLHWYVHHPGWRVRTLQSVTNERLNTIRGIDIRADGGCAVIPPTRFGDARYVALRPHHDVDHASLLPPDVQRLLGLDREGREPESSVRQITAPFDAPNRAGANERLTERIFERACDRVHDGRGRNDSGFWLAAQLRDNGVSIADAERTIERFVEQVPPVNTKGVPEPYTLQDALQSLRAAYRAPPRGAWEKRQRH